MTLEVFTTLDHPALQRHLLTAQPGNLEEAINLGEDYLFVAGPGRHRLNLVRRIQKDCLGAACRHSTELTERIIALIEDAGTQCERERVAQRICPTANPGNGPRPPQ